MSQFIQVFSVQTQTDDNMFLCPNRVDDSTHQSRPLIDVSSQFDEDRLMIKLLINDCKMHQQRAQIMKAELNRYRISQETMREQLLSLRQSITFSSIVAIKQMIEEEFLRLLSCSKPNLYEHTHKPRRLSPLLQFSVIDDLLHACDRLSTLRQELFDSTLKDEYDCYHYYGQLSRES